MPSDTFPALSKTPSKTWTVNPPLPSPPPPPTPLALFKLILIGITGWCYSWGKR